MSAPNAMPYESPATVAMRDDMLTGGLLTRRVLAWIVDAVLISAIATVIWLLLAALTVVTLGFGAPLFALLALLPPFYSWLFLMTPLQASPGQALFGLIVVRDADWGEPSFLQAVVYVAAYWATMAAGVIWTAVAVISTRHRTFHDMLSGLVVMRRSALRQYLTAGPMGWNMGTNASDGGRPFA
jgi:uncharacterized RDD family membrane protein YckC